MRPPSSGSAYPAVYSGDRRIEERNRERDRREREAAEYKRRRNILPQYEHHRRETSPPRRDYYPYRGGEYSNRPNDYRGSFGSSSGMSSSSGSYRGPPKSPNHPTSVNNQPNGPPAAIGSTPPSSSTRWSAPLHSRSHESDMPSRPLAEALTPIPPPSGPSANAKDIIRRPPPSGPRHWEHRHYWEHRDRDRDRERDRDRDRDRDRERDARPPPAAPSGSSRRGGGRWNSARYPPNDQDYSGTYERGRYRSMEDDRYAYSRHGRNDPYYRKRSPDRANYRPGSSSSSSSSTRRISGEFDNRPSPSFSKKPRTPRDSSDDSSKFQVRVDEPDLLPRYANGGFPPHEIDPAHDRDTKDAISPPLPSDHIDAEQQNEAMKSKYSAASIERETVRSATEPAKDDISSGSDKRAKESPIPELNDEKGHHDQASNFVLGSNDVQNKSQPISDSEDKQQQKDKPDPEVGSKIAAKPETNTEIEAGAKAKADIGMRPEAEVGTGIGPDAEAEAEAGTEVGEKAATETGTGPEVKAEIEAEAEAEAGARTGEREVESDFQPESKKDDMVDENVPKDSPIIENRATSVFADGPIGKGVNTTSDETMADVTSPSASAVVLSEEIELSGGPDIPIVKETVETNDIEDESIPEDSQHNTSNNINTANDAQSEAIVFPLNRLDSMFFELQNTDPQERQKALKYLDGKSAVEKLNQYNFYNKNITSLEKQRQVLREILESHEEEQVEGEKESRKTFHHLKDLWLTFCEELDRKEEVFTTTNASQPGSNNADSKVDDNNAVTTTGETTDANFVPVVTSSRRRGGYQRDAVGSEAEFLQILAQLQKEDDNDPVRRAMLTSAKIPNMIFDPIIRKNVLWKDTNELIRDKSIPYKRLVTDSINSFSAEEHEAFKEAFVLNPKQFGKIAKIMGGMRTFGECVLHYYQTKKTANYKALVAAKNRRSTTRKSSGSIKKKPRKEKVVTTPGGTTSVTEIEEVSLSVTATPSSESNVDVFDAAMANELKANKDPIVGEKRPEASNDDGVAKKKVKITKTTKKKKSDDQVPQEHIAALNETEERVRVAEEESTVEKAVTVKSEGAVPPQSQSSKRSVTPTPAATKEKVSSYWSLHEIGMFEKLLETYGTAWEEISKSMPNKSVVMLKNYYSKHAPEKGYAQLVLKAQAKTNNDFIEGPPKAPIQEPSLVPMAGGPSVGFFTPRGKPVQHPHQPATLQQTQPSLQQAQVVSDESGQAEANLQAVAEPLSSTLKEIKTDNGSAHSDTHIGQSANAQTPLPPILSASPLSKDENPPRPVIQPNRSALSNILNPVMPDERKSDHSAVLPPLGIWNTAAAPPMQRPVLSQPKGDLSGGLNLSLPIPSDRMNVAPASASTTPSQKAQAEVDTSDRSEQAQAAAPVSQRPIISSAISSIRNTYAGSAMYGFRSTTDQLPGYGFAEQQSSVRESNERGKR